MAGETIFLSLLFWRFRAGGRDEEKTEQQGHCARRNPPQYLMMQVTLDHF
jgi:hypothetical protein